MILHPASVFLLLLTTVLYAGYNLLVRQSASLVPDGVSTITATIALQLAALSVSLLFWLILRVDADQSFALSGAAYGWAVLAGLCIGAAEVCYFYLYAGFAGAPAMPVSLAMPVIVAGTVALGLVAAAAVFGERLGWPQIGGGLLVMAGLLLLCKVN